MSGAKLAQEDSEHEQAYITPMALGSGEQAGCKCGERFDGDTEAQARVVIEGNTNNNMLAESRVAVTLRNFAFGHGCPNARHAKRTAAPEHATADLQRFEPRRRPSRPASVNRLIATIRAHACRYGLGRSPQALIALPILELGDLYHRTHRTGCGARGSRRGPQSNAGREPVRPITNKG